MVFYSRRTLTSGFPLLKKEWVRGWFPPNPKQCPTALVEMMPDRSLDRTFELRPLNNLIVEWLPKPFLQCRRRSALTILVATLFYIYLMFINTAVNRSFSPIRPFRFMNQIPFHISYFIFHIFSEDGAHHHGINIRRNSPVHGKPLQGLT
jgi:hypothetical protein